MILWDLVVLIAGFGLQVHVSVGVTQPMPGLRGLCAPNERQRCVRWVYGSVLHALLRRIQVIEY